MTARERSERAGKGRLARVPGAVCFLGTVARAWASFFGRTAAKQLGTEERSTVEEPREAGLENSASSDSVSKKLLSDSNP